MADRRLTSLLLMLALIAAPALALRATCIGGSCHAAAATGLDVPFCAVPAGTRNLLAAGYDEQASPDVIAVAGRRPIVGTTGARERRGTPWPSRTGDEARVPLALWGTGVRAGPLPNSATLADVTPTLERILGLHPPRPSSGARRLGSALLGSSAVSPELVLEIVWRGVGSNEVVHASFLRSLLREGVGTMSASTGSLPVDPTAVVTTLGTGSPPAQHGIVGTYLRNPYTGALTRAWSRGLTPSALPTLANDMAQRGWPTALVTANPTDRGLVGQDFYVGAPTARIFVRPDGAAVARQAMRLLRTPPRVGLLGIVLEGPVSSMDRETKQIVETTRATADGKVLGVVTATGSEARAPAAIPAHAVRSAVGDALVAAATPSGLFLRHDASSQQIAERLSRKRMHGERLVAEAFPSYALALAGFC